MPRYATIVCSLALFVSLGGTANATGTQVCDSVGSPQIRTHAVRSLDLGVDTGWEGTSAVMLRCTQWGPSR